MCGRNVAEAKANFDTMPTEMMIDMSRMLPQLMWDLMYQSVDRAPEEILKRSSMGGNFTISNIRGPSKRFHMYGADITEFLPVSFLGQGLAHNVTCSSYAGELQVGFVACPTVFPDEELWKWPDYLRNGMEELLERVEGGEVAKPAAPVAVTALAKSGPSTTRKATGPRKAAAGGRAPATTVKQAATKAAPPARAAKAAPAGRKSAAKTASAGTAAAKTAPAKGAPAGRKSPAARRAAAAAASVQPAPAPAEPAVVDPAVSPAVLEPTNGVPTAAVEPAE